MQRKHPKYKASTSWDMEKESLFLIECGLSHILVVDIDPRDGGLESLAAMENMSPELIIQTGSGGYHYYFADWVRPSRYKPGKILPGIDIKAGHNSYVVAPYMPHPDGTYYEIIRDGIPMELPERISEMIISSRPRAKTNSTITSEEENPCLRYLTLVDMSKFTETSSGYIGPHPVHDSSTGKKLHNHD